MHLNETTRVYLDRLAAMSPPDKAARYRKGEGRQVVEVTEASRS